MYLRYAWIASVALAGCMFGPSRRDLAPANGGAGATVHVIRPSGVRVTGELLGWNEEGIILRSQPSGQGESLLVLVPEAEIWGMDAPGLPLFRGSDAKLGRRKARLAARYIRPIDDTLLRQLLAAYGQAELRRIQ